MINLLFHNLMFLKMFKDQLTKKEHFIFNVPIRSPAFPVLKREERVKQIINNLSLFVNIHKNSDSDLIQTSPYKTQVLNLFLLKIVKI